MGKREQERPLAPAADRESSDEGGGDGSQQPKKQSSKFLIYCAIVTAILVILVIAMAVLHFTVFRVKGPVIKMKGITVLTGLELINGTVPKPGVNMSLIADLSVKNPNIASFKYGYSTTTLYYHGQIVGEARNGPGNARARRTMTMNVNVDIIPERLMFVPNLKADLSSGLLSMTTYTRVPGRMKIVIFKRSIVVKMNCRMELNITSQQIQTKKCKQKVEF